MANVNEELGGMYMNVENAVTDRVLTVLNVTIEDIGQGSDKSRKAVVHWTETQLPALALNKVNLQAFKEALGPDTDDWVGAKVQLYIDRNVMFAGRKTEGVRLRIEPLPNRRRTGNDPITY